MITVENHGPFPFLLYEKLGKFGKVFDVLAIRGTFRLRCDGKQADFADEQQPLIMADQYHGDDPLTSSLRHETDLVIGRSKSNVHVIGHACTLAGKKRQSWHAGLCVGDKINKTVQLCGPRHWEYRRLAWRLGEPEPTDRVALQYELAYGGQYEKDGTLVQYPDNSVGRGYTDYRNLKMVKTYPAHQIDAMQLPWLKIMDGHFSTAGFGPLSRCWQPRAHYAGTYDEVWKETRWPFLPDDFNVAFYNSAPQDQQIEGYLDGDETLVLSGMLPESAQVSTALPGYIPLCVAESDSPEHRQSPLFKLYPKLDTVTIDLDRREIYQTWHLALPREYQISYIVLGTLVPPQVNSPAKPAVPGKPAYPTRSVNHG